MSRGKWCDSGRYRKESHLLSSDEEEMFEIHSQPDVIGLPFPQMRFLKQRLHEGGFRTMVSSEKRHRRFGHSSVYDIQR